MKINNYVWENDLSLNDLVLKQKEKIDELQNQLQQKENIIKEVREYIEDKYDYILEDDTFLDHDERIESKQIKHILEILDKEVN